MRVLAIGVVLLAHGLAAGPAKAEWRDVCGQLARSIERAHGIPRGLVEAVALAESGRWTGTSEASRPWPWTVTSGSDSFYLPTKQAAIAKVEELQASGRTNIDVGCMQVNLHYHGHRFASVEHALDPAANVQYGASFLRALREEARSWGLATARYHSRTEARGERYRQKVYRLWNEVRRRAPADRRVVPDQPVGAQQVALSAVARDAAPLVETGEEAAGPATAARVKRPLIDFRGTGGAGAAGLRIVRGN